MHYANPTLDRADHLRKDDTALQQMFDESNTRFYPVYQGDSLIQSSTPTFTAAAITKPPELTLSSSIFLGLDNTIACFAFSCSSYSEKRRQQIVGLAPDNAEFINLRTTGPLLNNHEGSILAYAKALTTWHDSVNFCDHCGTSLPPLAAGTSKNAQIQIAHGCNFPEPILP